MLAVNKKLEKTKIPKEFRANKVTYFKKRLVSILFIGKINAEKLCEKQKNKIIRVVKSVDDAVRNIKPIIK